MPFVRTGCGEDRSKVTDLVGVNGWSFSYMGRALALDAVVVENGSSQPILVDSLTGQRAATTKLRALDERASAGGATPLDKLDEDAGARRASSHSFSRCVVADA